ncbi:putative M16 family peptidase [Neospora caninum Liverpool]|uniref:Putative M16 family peptidase n=1 Tax=Neospora caninum (strain Liverpool) TaxID=572307 RepID=F0VJH7_NEOCL|nr:putative M16 family peptidase [Neospora caninum Liverpool]CBZ53888.1 putative M16 family peptidase [Neospora caninum Liverpool]|eukprot:XP_003883920.1 putative M16 family peptidase [Neospora caninum Liverpool]
MKQGTIRSRIGLTGVFLLLAAWSVASPIDGSRRQILLDRLPILARLRRGSSLIESGTSGPDPSQRLTRTDKIRKPRSDRRSYRYVELPNELRALLVSDPECDEAAASMRVGVGSTSDPPDIPGLAHFTEHMLFQGSKRFPGTHDFFDFVHDHGGYTNAFTSKFSTVFSFSIGPQFLEPGLDRLADIFSAPLLKDENLLKEVNAVHSEYIVDLTDDNHRKHHLIRQTASGGPLSNFTVGNLESLVERTKQQGIDPVKAMRQFHNRWYSSNLMTLAVVGRESLDILESHVRQHFSNVPNGRVTAPVFEECSETFVPLAPNELGTQVNVSLTEEGRSKDSVYKIGLRLFTFLRNLGAARPERWRVTEMAKIRQLGFTFADMPDPYALTVRAVEGLYYYTPEEVMAGDQLIYRFDPTLVQQYLQKFLVPDNVRLFIFDKKLAAGASREEYWFKIKHMVEPILEPVLKTWKDISKSPLDMVQKIMEMGRMALPAPNRYLPNNVAVLHPPVSAESRRETGTFPEPLVFPEDHACSNKCTVFHKQDTTFGSPKAVVELQMYYTGNHPDDVRERILTTLYVLSIKLALRERFSDAHRGGLSLGLSSGVTLGSPTLPTVKRQKVLTLYAAGFSDKLDYFFRAVAKNLAAAESASDENRTSPSPTALGVTVSHGLRQAVHSKITLPSSVLSSVHSSRLDSTAVRFPGGGGLARRTLLHSQITTLQQKPASVALTVMRSPITNVGIPVSRSRQGGDTGSAAAGGSFTGEKPLLEKRFVKLALDSLRTQLRVTTFNRSPLRQANDAVLELVMHPYIPVHKVYAAFLEMEKEYRTLDTIFEEVADWGKKIWNEAAIEGLVQGNISSESAAQLVGDVISLLPLKNIVSADSIAKPTISPLSSLGEASSAVSDSSPQRLSVVSDTPTSNDTAYVPSSENQTPASTGHAPSVVFRGPPLAERILKALPPFGKVRAIRRRWEVRGANAHSLQYRPLRFSSAWLNPNPTEERRILLRRVLRRRLAAMRQKAQTDTQQNPFVVFAFRRPPTVARRLRIAQGRSFLQSQGEVSKGSEDPAAGEAGDGPCAEGACAQRLCRGSECQQTPKRASESPCTGEACRGSPCTSLECQRSPSSKAEQPCTDNDCSGPCRGPGCSSAAASQLSDCTEAECGRTCPGCKHLEEKSLHLRSKRKNMNPNDKKNQAYLVIEVRQMEDRRKLVSPVEGRDTLKNIRDRAILHMISQWMSQRFFNRLRTEQQLGYLTAMRYSRLEDKYYYGFFITSTYDPAQVADRIVQFIYAERSKALSQEEFATLQRAAIDVWKQKPKNIFEEFSKNRRQVILGDRLFDINERMVAELERVTPEEIQSFKERTMFNAPWLLMEVYSQREEPQKLPQASITSGEGSANPWLDVNPELLSNINVPESEDS